MRQGERERERESESVYQQDDRNPPPGPPQHLHSPTLRGGPRPAGEGEISGQEGQAEIWRWRNVPGGGGGETRERNQTEEGSWSGGQVV